MSDTQAIITNGTGKMPPVRDGQKRKFSLEFKKGLVARVKAGEVAQEIAGQYGISRSVLGRWLVGEGLGVVGASNGSQKRKMSAATKKKISEARKKMFKRVDLKHVGGKHVK